ncbi:MAG: hypothetical protein DMG07_20460, partial [Acidobacteria bacterium]
MVLILAGPLGTFLRAAGDGSPNVPRFETDLLPILQANCLMCHGERVQQAGLDLRTRDSLLRGGRSGPAIQPGSPQRSLLLEKVTRGAMPPVEKKLTDREIERIRRWIEAGAPAVSAEAAAAAKPPNVAAVTEPEVLVSILNVKCLGCHGRRRQEAGLDLRTRESILKGGKSGPAMVLGDPDRSLMIQRIAAGEMPPAKLVSEAKVIAVTGSELETLRGWIAAGAPGGPEPSPAADSLVRAEERRFWSFQPPRRPPVHEIREKGRLRTPIDAFLLEKLQGKGLSFAPEADRLALLRRAYLDLIGVPPGPEEIEAYLADRSPGAYERVIDQLLASPHYGERWGRFWLDAAGYSDSAGKVAQDVVRPFAYRYRDYVIRAFNDDKPYDRFLLEQIAGDELFDYRAAKEPTPERLDKLIATGFLRTAPDGLTQFVHDRLDVLADQVEVLSSAVMGITVACARCHDHKYDPIPQRDYYRFSAIFRAAYDPYDWIEPAQRQLELAPESERRAAELHNAKVRQEVQRWENALREAALPFRKQLLSQKLSALPEGVREDVRQALETPPEQCTPAQSYLREKFRPWAETTPAELAQRFPDFKLQSDEFQRKIDAA